MSIKIEIIMTTDPISNVSWADCFDEDVDPCDDGDTFVDPCNLGKPIGDINRWKDIIETKLLEAQCREREYRLKYYPKESLPVLDYIYSDLIPGQGNERHLKALRLFYNPGYRYYRPIMMWYLENGLLAQYLNAGSTIYYCDRDHPDFWLLVKRAAEIAINPDLAIVFPVVLYQYFNWSTYDGLSSVKVNLSDNPQLTKINKLLKDFIVQKKERSNGEFVISNDFVPLPGIILQPGEDEFDMYEKSSQEFNKQLKELMVEIWPEKKDIFKELFV